MMHDGIGGTRVDGERSGVGILCNLLVPSNKVLGLCKPELSS